MKCNEIIRKENQNKCSQSNNRIYKTIEINLKTDYEMHLSTHHVDNYSL